MKITNGTSISDINTRTVSAVPSMVYKRMLRFQEEDRVKPMVWRKTAVSQQDLDRMISSARMLILSIIRQVKIGYSEYKRSITAPGAVLPEPTLEDLLILEEMRTPTCPCCGKPND